MSFITCSFCHASATESAPHGEGLPCPFALALHEAEVADRRMHTELLEAQRDATRLAPPAKRRVA